MNIVHVRRETCELWNARIVLHRFTRRVCLSAHNAPFDINKFSVLLMIVFRSTNEIAKLVCMWCCATYLSWLIVSVYNFLSNNIIIISHRYRPPSQATFRFFFFIGIVGSDRLKNIFHPPNRRRVFFPFSAEKTEWKMTHQFVNNISSNNINAQRRQHQKQHPEREGKTSLLFIILMTRAQNK